MKQVNNKFHGMKQKWFLTASLFTLLAGNYAFQMSSQNIGAVELSSSKPVAAKPAAAKPASNEMETQNDTYLKDKAKKEKEQEIATQKREDDRDKEMSRILGLQKVETAKTQAASVEEGSCTSGDCKTTAAPSVLLKMEDYNKLIARIAELEKQKPAVKPEEDKKEDAKPETRAEKRERLAQEKKDKEKEKQEERVAKFEDKMEDIKDKCDKDLQCLASEFTTALTRFDGKNAIPSAIVNRHFKSLIGGPLAKSLYNDSADGHATLEVLQSLMSEIPSQYAGIKQITMDTVRYQAQLPATRVNQGYKSADALSKQNNPQAYFQQLNQTREEQQALTVQSTAYTAAMEQSLRENGDQSSLSYYQRSYLPNMQKIMNSLMNPNGVDQAGQQQQQDTTTTTRTARTGQNGVQNAAQNQQQNSNSQKMTNPSTRGGAQQQLQWTTPTQNSGFQQGQPTTNSRGGRGRY
jgi:hypothetical protein